jgi:hypothetical protein
MEHQSEAAEAAVVVVLLAVPRLRPLAAGLLRVGDRALAVAAWPGNPGLQKPIEYVYSKKRSSGRRWVCS